MPGTPIQVDSYIAEQTVTAALGSATAEVRCAGEVSVGGQPVTDNESLQDLLAPLSVGSDLKVTFEPATEPTITETARRWPRGVVPGSAVHRLRQPPGRHRHHVHVRQDLRRRRASPRTGSRSAAPAGAWAASTSAPVTGSGAPVATGSTTSSTGTSSSPSLPSGTDTPETDAPTPTVPIADDGPLESASGPELVRRSIDAVPIGAFTAAGGGLLALGIWLLLGVTGSLARGLTTLKLPPFRD